MMKYKKLLFIGLLISYSLSFSQESKINFIPGIFPIDSSENFNITSIFGSRHHPIHKRMKKHNGIDIAARVGTFVYATGSGCIITSKYESGHGNTILIDHLNEYKTRYSHMSILFVEEGEEIKQGDVIGLVGTTGVSTGYHLHYEVLKNGINVNPKDYLFLRSEIVNSVSSN